MKHHGLTRTFGGCRFLAEANAVRQKLGRVAGKLTSCRFGTASAMCAPPRPFAVFVSNVPFDGTAEELILAEGSRNCSSRRLRIRAELAASHIRRSGCLRRTKTKTPVFELLGKNRSLMKHWEAPQATRVRGISEPRRQTKYMVMELVASILTSGETAKRKSGRSTGFCLRRVRGAAAVGGHRKRTNWVCSTTPNGVCGQGPLTHPECPCQRLKERLSSYENYTTCH